MINKLISENLIKILLINLTIIIVLPFNLILINKSYISELFSSNVFISFCVLLIFTFLVSGIFFFILNFITLRINKNVNNLFLYLISFSFIWIVINGVFLPVVGEHDAFLNLKYSIRLRYILLIKLIFILFLLIYLVKFKKELLFLKFCSIYIGLNIIYIVFSIFFILEEEEKFKHDITEFGNKNLIVLSLDGISGIKLSKEIQNNNNFKNLLKDFKLYKNVSSAWPATIHSINAELNEKVLDLNDANFKNNILNDKNIDTIVYGPYRNFVIDKTRVINRGRYTKYGKSHDTNIFFQTIFKGSLSRWGTPYAMGIFENIFYSQNYKKFINFISLDFASQNKLFDKNIHTQYYVQKKEFDLIFKKSKFKNSLKNVIRMYHFSFSHWPVKINENCDEVKKLNIDRSKHEEIAIKCLVKKINLFLKYLIKNNIYNNSLIVIKSDHAKPNNHYISEPYSLKINNSIYWGIGRYKPFILIKDLGEKKNNIEISNKHIFLADLASTYCNFFYDRKFCDDKYEYNNLLLNESTFKKNLYEIYIPQTEYAFINIKDFKKYEISNDRSLEDNLRELGISLD